MPSRHDLLFAALQSFVDTLAERFDVADVLYGLTDRTVSVLGATTAGVSLAGDDGVLTYVSAASEAAGELEGVQERSRQGPCHQAYRTAQLVKVVDIGSHDDWPAYRAKAEALGLHAVLGVPLTVGDRCIGALNVYSDHTREWTDEDLEVSSLLAKMASSYVLHASERDRIERVNEQLQHAMNTRIVIEQAKGVLAGEMGISLDASFQLLRRHARTHHASLHAIADAVVTLGLRPAGPPTT